MTVHTMPDRSSFRGRVATEVRAEMARQKYTINQLPGLLGKSQSYWSRRVNGRQPMDVDDLAALAGLLNVPVTRFFEASPGGPFSSPGGGAISQYHRRLTVVRDLRDLPHWNDVPLSMAS